MISNHVKFLAKFSLLVAINPPSPAQLNDFRGCREKAPAKPKVPAILFLNFAPNDCATSSITKSLFFLQFYLFHPYHKTYHSDEQVK